MNAKRLLAVATVLLAGCAPDLTGILAADSTGDLISPPAAREGALTALRAACGEPGAEPGGELRRLPYVQSVTADRAHVTWTSAASAAERVAIWSPDGGERVELGSEREPTRYLAGAEQRGVALFGLEPGAIHCYELIDGSGARVFGPAGFRTAPSGVASERPVRIAVFGDSGSGSADQIAVARQLATVSLDFVLHVGDLAYTSGTLDELERSHFAIYRELLPSIPLFSAVGDHDLETDGGGPYREVFTLPESGGPGADELWYSVDWGTVHVAVLNALDDAPAQRAWLERDLAATSRPFRIVVVHEPPYSSGFHGSAEDVREAYQPIFERHGVQLVLSGDDHDYERSVPIHGVTYVVTGGGGRSVRPVGASSWTAFSVTAFHFVYVEADAGELRLHAIDATGREFDGAVIARAAS